MLERIKNKWIYIILILSVVALFIEYGIKSTLTTTYALHILDLAVLLCFAADFLSRLLKEEDRTRFLKEHPFLTAFFPIVILLFFYSKYLAFVGHKDELQYVALKLIFLRYLFLGLKMFVRPHRFNTYLKAFYRNPAQTTVLSFASVIAAGTMFLMLPYSTADGMGLNLINAIFTSTSAVCVTGLIVANTATAFSLFGKFIILILMQCGGLGIMILTYFTAFLVGRRVTIEEKIEISYLLNEQDLSHLTKAVVKIVMLTFAIEAVGVLFLFITFGQSLGVNFRSVFYSVFHAVSAFCNAGFSLYTTSFEIFRSDLLFNFTICILIILGGISFPVLINGSQWIRDYARAHFKTGVARSKLTLNSTVVLIITAVLLVVGTFLIYALEHHADLLRYDLKTQYLSSFFQSVTLRTAGFNTINIARLQAPTLLIMMVFMFIGGAAGSTAGGVKVNTIAVVYAYIKSILQNRYSVILHGYFLQKYVVSRALLIILMASIVVFCSTVLLTITEDFPLQNTLFEVVSAFGTVGLSTGITPALTVVGKAVIVATMFLGRLGPLTIIAALAARKKYIVKYPEGQITMS